MLLQGLWLLTAAGPGHDPRDAALIGRHWVERSRVSSVIKVDPGYSYPAGQSGYDGEFVYFIAIDPANARYYTDDPSYRYTRIFYPLLARAVALGHAVLVPYTLLLLNWLAVGGGTLALAAWLRRRGQSSWFALAFGLYNGILVSLQRDTTEALAYSLVAVGVFVFDAGQRRRVLWSAGIFSLAALTRETTVIFPIAYALGLALGGTGDTRRYRVRQGALLAGVALLPLLAWKLYLVAWLGTAHDPGLLLEPIPLLGFVASRQVADSWVELAVVLLPALISLAVAAAVLRKRIGNVEAWALLANVVLFVLFIHRSSLVELHSSTRVTTGVVVAAILALPAAVEVLRSWVWFPACAVAWLALLPAWLLGPELQYLIAVSRPIRHFH